MTQAATRNPNVPPATPANRFLLVLRHAGRPALSRGRHRQGLARAAASISRDTHSASSPTDPEGGCKTANLALTGAMGIAAAAGFRRVAGAEDACAQSVPRRLRRGHDRGDRVPRGPDGRISRRHAPRAPDFAQHVRDHPLRVRAGSDSSALPSAASARRGRWRVAASPRSARLSFCVRPRRLARVFRRRRSPFFAGPGHLDRGSRRMGMALDPCTSYVSTVLMTQSWWLYLLVCRDGRTYAGIATHVAARFAAHSSGKGANSCAPTPLFAFLAPRPLPASPQRSKRKQHSRNSTAPGSWPGRGNVVCLTAAQPSVHNNNVPGSQSRHDVEFVSLPFSTWPETVVRNGACSLKSADHSLARRVTARFARRDLHQHRFQRQHPGAAIVEVGIQSCAGRQNQRKR